MNIFYTSKCPIQSAIDHCTIHRNKMIIEYAQLLSTTHHVLNTSIDEMGVLYKKTHANHPAALWVRDNKKHYFYVLEMLKTLCIMFYDDTKKHHKTSKLIDVLDNIPLNIKSIGFAEPPQVMPDHFKNDSCIIAYRQYLKAKYTEWSSRDKPLKVKFDYRPDWL